MLPQCLILTHGDHPQIVCHAELKQKRYPNQSVSCTPLYVKNKNVYILFDFSKLTCGIDVIVFTPISS